eukprot:TRINITY_DN30470_c0_g1_i1.p1 TRINITY_DN30470_c0_g1~~TRINITY_DN30470_c0_g1_i1.p1  ORF type:complete len:206 (+),score=21.48 TRINITY_DN30470_c0_g1_i1:27-620(+)
MPLCTKCKTETVRNWAAVTPDFGDVLTVPQDGEAFGGETGKEGLIMQNGVLPEKYAKLELNPFERVVLLSNGNLQSTVSAWMSAGVMVKVVKNETVRKYPDGSILVDRVVDLIINSRLFCTAHSAVHVHDPGTHELVTSGGTGLGQLFRILNVLPTFTLLAAGRPSTGGLWRLYDLSCPFVSTRILETFPSEGLKMP